jgi:hypothetical protein
MTPFLRRLATGLLAAALPALAATASTAVEVDFAVDPEGGTYGVCVGCGDQGETQAMIDCGLSCWETRRCEGGWAAAAASYGAEPNGYGILCSQEMEMEAVVLSWAACLAAANNLCFADRSFSPDGTVRDIPENFDIVYISQILLGTLGYDPGSSDGLETVATRAAMSAFRSDLGLPATDGRITQESAWELVTAAGGKQALIDLMDRAVIGPLRESLGEDLLVAAAAPAPRLPLGRELAGYDEPTRLYAMSLVLRGAGYPCADRALSAEAMSEEAAAWNVTCPDASYTLLLRPEGGMTVAPR